MLNYQVYGQTATATSPQTTLPLIVLHGLLGSLENWRTFARRQQDQRTVIAIDLRNHGASPHVEGMSYRLMAEDVLAVTEQLELKQFDLMGHSMGGKVAMYLALSHATLIRKLIVVDIAPVHYPPRHQALLQAMITMPISSFKTRKQADEWLAPTVQHPFERAFLLTNLRWNEQRKLKWQPNLNEIVRHYLNINAFPDFTTQFYGETLFIAGGQSDYLEPDRWQRAKQYFPNAKLTVIATAGHLPHVQTPDEFNQVLEQTLAR